MLFFVLLLLCAGASADPINDCGRLNADSTSLVVGGVATRRAELPWHALIYTKTSNPYKQLCGGSLISTTVVLSVAHCFWTENEKQLPASQFAVAVGKLHRPWNDPTDEAQKSDVKEIHIPEPFQGDRARYQDDISVIVLAQAFSYTAYIRPVCISFDYILDIQQLYHSNKGKMAIWAPHPSDEKASQTLQVIEIPYMDVRTCINTSPIDFRAYITSDQFCAGTQQSNSTICGVYSGSGLVFPSSTEQGTERYYLRGVLSSAPLRDGNGCNAAIAFTQITKHEHFIKQFSI